MPRLALLIFLISSPAFGGLNLGMTGKIDTPFIVGAKVDGQLYKDYLLGMQLYAPKHYGIDINFSKIINCDWLLWAGVGKGKFNDMADTWNIGAQYQNILINYRRGDWTETYYQPYRVCKHWNCKTRYQQINSQEHDWMITVSVEVVRF